MNGYTYGYLKSSIMAIMDLDDDEMNQNDLMNKIPFYLNRGMTEICSSIKPDNAHISFYVSSKGINKPIDISSLTDKIYIGFRGRSNYFLSLSTLSFINSSADESIDPILETETMISDRVELINENGYELKEAHDEDFVHLDYKTIICKKSGYYKIAVKLRWWKFQEKLEDDKTFIECPEDILDALILYVASELWSLEDERKGTIIRNKYELALSRIDDTNFDNTSTFNIEGGW